jgi:type IV pilus assembly protein PilQ
MRVGKALLGLVLMVAASLVVAGATPSFADDAAMKQVGMVRTGTGSFSIDVQGADVHTVVKAISEFSGRNIVVAKDVKSSVSVSLRNVGWQEALRTILRTNGLDYVDEGGIIRVDDMQKLAAETVDREAARAKAAELVPLETRVVKLNYANANELVAPIQSTLTRRGTVQTDKRTNSLIITDVPSGLDAVEKMARDLDSTTPQIEITAKLVDVDVEALRDIGVTWNMGLNSSGVPSGPVSTPNFTTTDPVPPFHPFDQQDQVLAGGQNTSIADPAASFTYGIFKSWITLDAQLQVLEQNRKANIISNPRITTVDNREAKIIVGQKIPLIIQDVAGNSVSQLQTIGIQLKVTPHLTEDKKIIMDLHPEVSDLATQSTVQGGIIINTSEADTRVMVEDGQTAVIGGLIRTNDSHVRSGVPVLKDLPVLGTLFRSEDVVKQNRELIIFVTPKLITQMASN